MNITSINKGGNISFKSGYPTFGTGGHLSYDPKNSIYDNTNPFYKLPSPPAPDSISQIIFRGCPPYRIRPTGGILKQEHAHKFDVMA